MKDDLIYRLVRQEDAGRVRQLWQYCFEDDEAFVNWYFAHYYQPENTLGIYKNDQLVASTQMIPYKIALRRCSINSAYIVGVETAPEVRRSGLGSGMLLACLQEMRSRRQAIALLMPFEGSFYYPYQWQFCYYHRQYTLELTELKGVAMHYGEMTAIDAVENIPLLARIYQDFVRGRNGYILRTEQNWRNLLADCQLLKAFSYVLFGEQGAEGYIIYYFEGSKIIVREMAYSCFAARNGLLDFLYGHRSHKQLLEWFAPDDDSLVAGLQKSKTGTVFYPFLMARIVDVSALLSQLAYSSDCGTIKLKLEDRLASWNDGVFTFQVVDGCGSLTEAEDEDVWDLSMGLDGLTQLVMGSSDAEQLYNEQKLFSNNEQALAIWEKLWPRQRNYINEYY